MWFIDCPGTKSEDAGKVSACQGCPNQQICSSGATKQPDPGKKFISLKNIDKYLYNVYVIHWHLKSDF